MAVIIPFFALPQNLVPGSMVEDVDGHGTQLLTSNLYVIDGFIILCLAGILLVVHKLGEPATATAGDSNLGLEGATLTG